MSNLTREEIKNYNICFAPGRGNIAPKEHHKLRVARNIRVWYDNMDEDKKSEFKKDMSAKALENYKRRKEAGIDRKISESARRKNLDRINQRNKMLINCPLLVIDPAIFA